MSVTLGPLIDQHFENFMRWYTDPDFLRWIVYSPSPDRPIPDSVPEEIVREVFTSMKESDMVRAIMLNGTGHIGTIGLKPGSGDIKVPEEDREMFIEIGNPGHRGKGYGTLATVLFLRFLFEEKGFGEVKLGVFEYNRRAVAMYEKLGFEEYDRLKGEIYFNGKHWDLIKMRLSVGEFSFPESERFR